MRISARLFFACVICKLAARYGKPSFVTESVDSCSFVDIGA